MNRKELMQWDKEELMNLDNQRKMEEFAEFMARMIEKYGDQVLAEIDRKKATGEIAA